jgi:RNA polymerase sigma-70 factor (ECF subfamily)
MQKTNDREAARELVQAVFVAFFHYKRAAHTIGSLRAYLYTMLKNGILDHYRHMKVQEQYKLYVVRQHATPHVNNVDEYVDTRELENQLREEILKLPPQCRQVFKLRREEELSNKEIARQMNISENTVEQHMRKALRLLNNALRVAYRSFFMFLHFFI